MKTAGKSKVMTEYASEHEQLELWKMSYLIVAKRQRQYWYKVSRRSQSLDDEGIEGTGLICLKCWQLYAAGTGDSDAVLVDP